MRTLLAEARFAARTGVRLSLEGQGFTVCAEAEDAPRAIDAALRERPELCVIDVDLPGGGVAAAEEIRTGLPHTTIVMMSGSPSEEELLAAVRAGALGYLLKDMDPERLPLALRATLEGEAALPRALMSRILPELRRAEAGPIASLSVELTAREREVLEMLDRGLTTGEIADKLSISAVTVRRHISEAMRKLDVPDRDAALRVLRDQSAEL